RFSPTEDVVTRGEMHVGRAPCNEPDCAGAKPREERVAAQQLLHGRHFCLLAARPDPRPEMMPRHWGSPGRMDRGIRPPETGTLVPAPSELTRLSWYRGEDDMDPAPQRPSRRCDRRCDRGACACGRAPGGKP